MKPRTSTSHPLLTLCPGRRDALSAAGPWRRDLDADVDVIAAWVPSRMLTLMESREFALLGVPQFAQVSVVRFFGRRHVPIVDAGIPDGAFEDAWKAIGAEARGALKAGCNDSSTVAQGSAAGE
jgi:hypothetical protein